MPDWYARNFTHTEVACRHCKKENMCPVTIGKFQFARDFLGLPIYGTFCRCIVHNKAEGGVERSAHIITDTIQCRAGDVSLVRKSRQMTKMQFGALHEALYEAGFRRFGLSRLRKFIHADDHPDKPTPCMWVYPYG